MTYDSATNNSTKTDPNSLHISIGVAPKRMFESSQTPKRPPSHASGYAVRTSNTSTALLLRKSFNLCTLILFG